MAPRREPTRPLLPQHARHCPVLEAGSALGFMVYAPLEPKESLYIEYEGEGRYTFAYYLQTQDGKRTPLFKVTMSLSVGGVGMVKEEVTFAGVPMVTREAALAVARAFLVPEDMGTPAGAVALRGATNFQTPPNWDTVYAATFNQIEARPVSRDRSLGPTLPSDVRLVYANCSCAVRRRFLRSPLNFSSLNTLGSETWISASPAELQSFAPPPRAWARPARCRWPGMALTW
jgi:hypothetical protein